MPDDKLSWRLFPKGTGTLAGSFEVRLSVPGILALSEAACSATDESAEHIAAAAKANNI